MTHPHATCEYVIGVHPGPGFWEGWPQPCGRSLCDGPSLLDRDHWSPRCGEHLAAEIIGISLMHAFCTGGTGG